MKKALILFAAPNIFEEKFVHIEYVMSIRYCYVLNSPFISLFVVFLFSRGNSIENVYSKLKFCSRASLSSFTLQLFRFFG